MISSSGQEYLSQIEDCEQRESRLNEWEVNFLSSLRSQVEAGRNPTLKQVERLDEVWEKATKRG